MAVRKITDEQIKEIRRRVKEGPIRLAELAQEFGVSVPYISLIIHNEVRTDPDYSCIIVRYKPSAYNTNTKLNWEQVREIRQRIINGESAGKIFTDYDVSITNIRGIASNELWFDSDYDPPSPYDKGPKPWGEFRWGQVKNIRRLYKCGISIEALADEYGVDIQSISDVVSDS